MLLSLIVFVEAALAQSTYGAVVGTVSYASQAVLPGATVTLTEVQTGVARTGATSSHGAYQNEVSSVNVRRNGSDNKDYGASLTDPVVRGKTFFFATYERLSDTDLSSPNCGRITGLARGTLGSRVVVRGVRLTF